jgi:MoaD family protein
VALNAVNYLKIVRSYSSDVRGGDSFLVKIRVKVAYFALARDLAGTNEEEIQLDTPANIDHLFSEILNAHPKLQGIREIIRTIVNGRVILENAELKDEDHVALLPAVGGG